MVLAVVRTISKLDILLESFCFASAHHAPIALGVSHTPLIKTPTVSLDAQLTQLRHVWTPPLLNGDNHN
jgi:hypothetical protein